MHIKKPLFASVLKRGFVSAIRILISQRQLQDLAPCFKSRLPGFIGLVPLPALDKNIDFINYFELSHRFPPLSMTDSGLLKNIQPADPVRRFLQALFTGEQADSHIAFAILAESNPRRCNDIGFFQKQI